MGGYYRIPEDGRINPKPNDGQLGYHPDLNASPNESRTRPSDNPLFWRINAMLVETIGEAMFLNRFVNGLARGVSKLKAQQEWIPANFVPARRPYWSTLRGLKHQFEHGTRYYLHEDEMAEAFRANGIRVEGEKVYAKKRYR